MGRSEPTMPNKLETLLAAGRRALAGGDWTSARKNFREALERDESAEACHGLGEASWWLGDLEGTVSHFERAYAAFRRRQDPARAAEMALRNALHAFNYLANDTATAGWLARAERLIEVHGLEELRGELLVMRASCSEDSAAAERYAREAMELARGSEDPDLELWSLSSMGSALVGQGRVKDGLALLDEALAGSLSGEGERLETVVFTSCELMTSCARCAAFERAVECIRVAERFARRYGCPFLYSECRVVYGEVLLATGDWPAAERELKKAIELSRDSIPAYHAWAVAVLAELRVAQGGIEEAERLVTGLEGFAVTVPAIARIRLLQGDPALAAVTVERRLEAIGEEPLESVRLLELLGEAEVELGKPDAAAQRARGLVERGVACGCRLMEARGERLLGASSPEADAAVARRHFDAALSKFVRLNMPYEAGRTRLLFAASLRNSDHAVAKMEARAALTVLDDLGAVRDADAACRILRELGVRATRASPPGLQPLTKREREVFVLLGEGLSNPEIAQRLFISRKTVEHHVGHILAKLHLRSRAQAAAEAVRRVDSE